MDFETKDDASAFVQGCSKQSQIFLLYALLDELPEDAVEEVLREEGLLDD